MKNRKALKQEYFFPLTQIIQKSTKLEGLIRSPVENHPPPVHVNELFSVFHNILLGSHIKMKLSDAI